MSRSFSADSTAVLLTRIRDGDEPAKDELVARFLPVLRRWARGRLPAQARAVSDTDDLVQVGLIRALDNIHSFEASREGDFLAYMRRTLLNAIRDEIRRPANRAIRQPVDDAIPDEERSHLEHVIGQETLESYEEALTTLTENQRNAVILRVEFGYSHADVAAAMGLHSPDAARMLAARAVAKLAEALGERRKA